MNTPSSNAPQGAIENDAAIALRLALAEIAARGPRELSALAIMKGIDLVSGIDLDPDDFWTLICNGGLGWTGVEAMFAQRYAFRFGGLKQSRIQGVQVRTQGAGGFCFHAGKKHSSSGVQLEGLKVVRSGADSSPGFAFDGAQRPDGGWADVCNYSVRNCCFDGQGTGFGMSGRNLLGMHFAVCQASGADIGFLARAGGSRSTFVDCGGSFTKRLFWFDGGFSMTVQGGRSEDCGVGSKWWGAIVQHGGDDAGGHGQVSGLTIAERLDDGVKGIAYALCGAGYYTVQNCWLTTAAGWAGPDITVENRHQTETAVLDLRGVRVNGKAPRVAVKGRVQVVCANGLYTRMSWPAW